MPIRPRRTAAVLVAFGVTLAARSALGDGGGPGTAQPGAPAPKPDGTGLAAETAALEALLDESVVTTASRSAERASVAPATVFNISGAEMRESGIRTVDEALEFLGLGVYVGKPRDYTSGIDVGAQGLILRDGGRHVLVLLDGLILNSSGTGRISLNEALGVPLDIIDHVEVMLGPGSVIYGSNAILAVINVVTRSARDFEGIHAIGELGTSLAQNAAGNPTFADGTRPGLRYRLSLGAGHKFKVRNVAGEITAMAEWTEERSSSYEVTPFSRADLGNQSLLPGQTSWGGQAGHTMRTPNALVTLKLGHFRLLASVFDYQRSMPLVGTFMDSGAMESQTGARLDLKYTWEIDQRLTLTSRLHGSYSRFSESSNYGENYWCLPEQVNGCHFEMSERSGWIGAEQQLVGDWFVDGKVVTTVGWDARLRLFDSTPANYLDLLTNAPPSSVPLPHSEAITFRGAVFVQQVWRPLGWMSFNVGARLDAISQYGARISPRAAVVFTPAPSTVIRLSYNEAFRAPSQYESTEFDPTYRITPRDLRPETVRSVELELQQRLGRLNLSLRGYAAFYDNMIESRVATPSEQAVYAKQLSPTADAAVVVVNDNLTSLQIFGGSASLQVRLPAGFHAGGTFNIARTQTPDGASYERLPTWFGNFRAGWRSGEQGYSVSLVGVYAASRVVLFNADPSAYRVDPRLDLRLTVAGPVKPVAGLSWRASLGFDFNPDLPYAIAGGTDSPRGYALYPDQPRMFGFLGLRYDRAGL